MRTEDLVAALAADTAPRPTPGARMGKALPVALAASLGLVLIFWGLRGDLGAVLVSALLAKTVVPLAVAAAALWLARELVRPDAPVLLAAGVAGLIGGGVIAGLAAALVAGGGVAALVQELARALATGSLWVCLLSVPVLAAAPLAAALWALRAGAPLQPAAAGAAAGLLAGAAGAAVYSLYCTEDAALFVIPAYGAAIGLVCLCGALIGRRLLRW